MNFIKKKSWFHLNPHHVTKRADFTTKQQTQAFPTWTYSTNCISELEYGERCELRGSLTCLVRPLLSRPTMSQNNVRLLSACFRSTQPVLNSLTSVLFITSRCLDNLGLLCKTDLSDYGPLWEVASKSWFLRKCSLLKMPDSAPSKIFNARQKIFMKSIIEPAISMSSLPRS